MLYDEIQEMASVFRKFTLWWNEEAGDIMNI